MCGLFEFWLMADMVCVWSRCMPRCMEESARFPRIDDCEDVLKWNRRVTGAEAGGQSDDCTCVMMNQKGACTACVTRDESERCMYLRGIVSDSSI